MKRWLLLRGLMRDARHWGAFPARLQQNFPGAEVLCLDLPGNGGRCHIPSPASIAGMLDACRGDPLLLGRRERFGIIAMSLGAMVATEWAARYPQEVSALVLVNTSMRPFSPFHQRLRPANYLRILRLLGSGNTADIERAVLALTSRHRRDDAALLANWCGWRDAQPVTRANVLRQLLAAARYRAPAVSLSVPTLLLASAQDALVSVRCSEEIAARWRAPLQVHPDAGHDLPLDDADWVVRRISEWLQAAGTQPAVAQDQSP